MRKQIIIILFLLSLQLRAQWTELNGASSAFPFYCANSDKFGNVYATKSDVSGKSYLAKWDGNSWSDIGNTRTNLNYNNFIVVIPDNLGSVYSVFGITPSNGGNQRRVLGQWDGTNWTEIFSLNQTNFENFWSFSFNSNAFYFNVTGIRYKNSNTDLDTIYQTIYKWSNNNLSVVYKNINQRLNFTNYMMDFKCDSNGDLFACGDYHNSLGEYFVAKWNGNSWVELSGINSLKANGKIRNLFIDNKDNIFALGNPIASGVVKTAIIYKWNGTQWIDLDPLQTIFSSSSYGFGTIAVDTLGNLYITPTNFVNPLFTVFKFNGTQWFKLIGSNSNSPYTNGSINTFCFDKNQDLIASGDFINSNGDWYLAKYANSKFVSVNENSISNAEGLIYPNPTTSKLNFNLANATNQKFNLSLTNGLGQIVITKQDADLNEGLDISNLSNGIYFLKIQNQFAQKTFKVVKE